MESRSINSKVPSKEAFFARLKELGIDGSRFAEPEGFKTKKSTRIRKAKRHPQVKDEYGTVLADSINAFAGMHNPPIKYEGMRNALDVLTACKSPDGSDYDFHYEIIKYRPDGVYIRRVSGPGHRTSNEEMKELIRHGYNSAASKGE